MARTVKLTETLLTNIVEEVISKLVDDGEISEISINAKKRNVANVKGAFEKGKQGYNAIKTFAVFTAENPDSRETDTKLNRKHNKSLYGDLKNGGYLILPAKGKFMDNVEHPFMVINIDLVTCKYLCGKYQQTSFVFHVIRDGELISEYWEKADTSLPYNKNTNDYVKKDEDKRYIDQTEADDMYTSIGQNIGKEFKYSIPFSIFNEVNQRLNENLERIVEERSKRGSVDTKESLLEYAHKLGKASAGNGMYRMAIRKAINENIQIGNSNERAKQPLRTWKGYVVLRHDSNSRITNGVIDGRGKQKNNYSKNSDASNYFWASEKPGKDPSNTASIHYYCLVEPDRIYDFETNPKGYNSLKDAMANEEYVSGRWGDGAIAVMTSNQTEISFIEDDGGIDGPGAVYDSQWHMLRSLGKFYNNERNQKLAMKMKPYRDVEVPEFLRGYNYQDLMNCKTDEE